MKSKGDWNEGKGFIVMMDALGMRSEDLEKSRVNMRKIHAFKEKHGEHQQQGSYQKILNFLCLEMRQ